MYHFTFNKKKNIKLINYKQLFVKTDFFEIFAIKKNHSELRLLQLLLRNQIYTLIYSQKYLHVSFL